MLVRLEMMGPETGAARGRRMSAATLERHLGLEQRTAVAWPDTRDGGLREPVMQRIVAYISLKDPTQKEN